MDIKTDTPMPKLDPSNYGPWLITLRSAAVGAEATAHFNSNPTPPQDPVAFMEYDKKKNFLLGKIIATIPSEIANLLLTPTSDPSPYDLIQQIKQHLDTTNANDHKYLKQQAEETHFLPGTTLEEYVAQHEKLRAQMIAAQYPNITDGKITVEFMIDGLKHNPFTAPVGLQLIALNPTDIKDFVHKFKRISSYQEATAGTPLTPQGLPPARTGLSGDYHGQNRNTGYRGPRPRNRDRNFKPCSFHIRRGIPNPRHSDYQFRHPDHPKNKPSSSNIPRNPRARAARMQQHYDYEDSDVDDTDIHNDPYSEGDQHDDDQDE